MFDNVTQQLAKLVTTIGFDNLPEELVRNHKLMLLDNMGCALGSYITDRARIALELVEEFGGKPQASIIGNHCTSYALAAFANSELINALDYCYNTEGRHLGIYVTSPCLAIAEREHASGKELITALAVAHEVGGRAVSSLAQHKVPKKESPYWEASPRFGYATTIFGGVAGASKLLGLDIERMQNAFGIAGASTPVPALQHWDHTGGPVFMVKYNSWSGWIAQLATVAPLLAARGFTGDTTILDGEWGYWQIVGSPFFKVNNLLEGLGETWYSGEADFKPYPCCSCNFAGIDGINKIMQEHGIKPEEIEEILVKNDPELLTARRVGMDVRSFGDAQFRNTLIFALAAYYGDTPGPAWQLPATINDPKIRALMEKVKVEVHPRASELLAKQMKTSSGTFFADTIAEITAKGRKFTTEVSVHKGKPENPMTEAELVEKFRNNASYSMLKSSRVEEVIQMISALEEVDDIAKLTRLTTII